MATILLLIHFISLWLTLMSLLQPCDDNCIKKNCDSTNSHASERILDRSSEIEHVTVTFIRCEMNRVKTSNPKKTPSHIKEFNATNIEDTPI